MQTPTEFALVKHRKLMNEKCSDIEHPALWAASGSAFALLAILLFRQVLVVQLTGKAWTKHKTMHVLHVVSFLLAVLRMGYCAFFYFFSQESSQTLELALASIAGLDLLVSAAVFVMVLIFLLLL